MLLTPSPCRGAPFIDISNYKPLHRIIFVDVVVDVADQSPERLQKTKDKLC